MHIYSFPQEVYQATEAINDFLIQLGVDTQKVKNSDLMLCAFVHKSYASDFKPAHEYDHNERLEFVWDAVLSSVIASQLFVDFPQMQESDMTLYKIALVREDTLSRVSKKIGLHQQIFISKGEENNGGREKASITSDALEALIGYISLDLWYRFAQEFVLKTVYPEIEKISKVQVKSYKTLVQEYVQKKYKQLPVYIDDEYEKDDKNNVVLFVSEIEVNGKIVSKGYGGNKKKAQEASAKNYYETLE